MASKLPEPCRELIPWEEADRLIDRLLPQFRREFTAMVMITRGGIIPGGLLADAMNVTHILTAAVDFPAHSSGERSALMEWPEFIQFSTNDKLRARPTLIVDDVWGSGRTMTAVKNRVSAAGGGSQKPACCTSIRTGAYLEVLGLTTTRP